MTSFSIKFNDRLYFSGLALNNKFFPVHCVVTREESPQRVLQDGFVIIPSQTKFHDIISVILKKLEVEIGKIGANERVDGKNRVRTCSKANSRRVFRRDFD